MNETLVALASLAAVVGAGVWVTDRAIVRAEFKFFGRRLTAGTPSHGVPANGTGVERTNCGAAPDKGAAVLPRSPMASVAADPRPAATGPQLPATAAPVAAAGVQTPVGSFEAFEPTGPARKQVILHG